MALECKRVYVGGLPPGVSTDEVAERFSKFGQVSGIDIHTKKTDDGNALKENILYSFVNWQILNDSKLFSLF